jgi:hypothetical protein
MSHANYLHLAVCRNRSNEELWTKVKHKMSLCYGHTSILLRSRKLLGSELILACTAILSYVLHMPTVLLMHAQNLTFKRVLSCGVTLRECRALARLVFYGPAEQPVLFDFLYRAFAPVFQRFNDRASCIYVNFSYKKCTFAGTCTKSWFVVSTASNICPLSTCGQPKPLSTRLNKLT